MLTKEEGVCILIAVGKLSFCGNDLTQKQLAERTGIDQADISKLENGTRNLTIGLLKKLADGMDMALKIEFVPKPHAHG